MESDANVDKVAVEQVLVVVAVLGLLAPVPGVERFAGGRIAGGEVLGRKLVLVAAQALDALEGRGAVIRVVAELVVRGLLSEVLADRGVELPPKATSGNASRENGKKSDCTARRGCRTRRLGRRSGQPSAKRWVLMMSSSCPSSSLM